MAQKRAVPACPLCGEVPEVPPLEETLMEGKKPVRLTAEAVLMAHLERHRPTQPCRHEGGEVHQGWKLDLDGVRHFRRDVSVWYCVPCGRYATDD